MRRRLLSQSGLKLSSGMTLNIKKNENHTLTGDIRVRFARTSRAVALSTIYVDCPISNGGTGSDTASITIDVNTLTAKLTELEFKTSSDNIFYYGLFPVTSGQGVIVAGTTSTLIKQQYKTQSTSALNDTSSIDWYNSRLTMSASGSPISHDGGSATVTVTYAYANWFSLFISNTNDVTYTSVTDGVDRGSLATAGTTTYSISVDANTTSSERSWTISLVYNSLGKDILDDAIVNNGVEIKQNTEPYYFTITGSKTDYKGKMPNAENIPIKDIPSEIDLSVNSHTAKSIYLHTNNPAWYNSNGTQTFGIDNVLVYECDRHVSNSYHYVFGSISANGAEFKKVGGLRGTGFYLNKLGRQSDTFFECDSVTSWWQKSGASESDYYIELNSYYSFERESYYQEMQSTYPTSDQIYVRFNFNYADSTSGSITIADIYNGFYVKAPASIWV